MRASTQNSFIPEMITGAAKPTIALGPALEAQSSRRVWIMAPFAFAGLFGSLVYQRTKRLPDFPLNGTGTPVTLVLFFDNGTPGATVRLRKIRKTKAEWRSELSSETYAVTRCHATELPFHNLYWNNHDAGLYRCNCCGNAVFRSSEKFDSETGWPSFCAPAAACNIELHPDQAMGISRVEVECAQCEAHLGHVFDDGPTPTGKRYCLNSAALQFRKAA